MPGMIYKFNPENSDFFVGNFLTVNKKKAASQQEAALKFLSLFATLAKPFHVLL